LEDADRGVVEEVPVAFPTPPELFLPVCSPTVCIEELERHADRLEQHELPGGLDDVAVARYLSDTLDIVSLGVAGQEDDRYVVKIENPGCRSNAVDSHIYGFTLQELNFPLEAGEYRDVAREYLPQLPPEKYPHLARMTRHIIDGEYDGLHDFDFGLNLILDGLERLHHSEN
jgi:hypothetical protein